MKLPFLKKKQAPRGDVYIGIFFKEQDGVVMYLEDSSSGLKILGTEFFSYTNGWENLVNDVDEVLYKLETKTHLTPQKAIFFIYSHFVDQEHKNIKRPFLSKIKELSRSLDLKPLGYIECQEAIVEHFKASEHDSLHMILLEFDKTVLTVSLFQGGANIYQNTIARSGDLFNTLTPLLQEMKQKFVLPNRLIFYDEKSLTNDVSTLLSNRWDPDVFQSPPKIDILTQDQLHKSLVDVFARQIHAAPSHAPAAAPYENLAPPPTADHEHIEEASRANIKENPEEVMGFVIGDESSTKNSPQHSSSKKAGIGAIFKALKLPSFKPMGSRMLPFAGVAILVLLLLGLGGTEYVLHKAVVNVKLPSTPVNKTVDVGNDLTLEKGSDSRQVQDTAPATGTKQVGEKAKGSVTIYNSNLSGSVNLSKGTKLSGPNNLSFVLDADAKVASASGDASDLKPSTTKANVVAGDIGTEYNISSGSKLSIAGESTSSIIAKADSSFTGGSKKQVKVASKDDIAKLTQKITDQAKKDAAESVKSKVGSGRVIVNDLTTVTLENQKLSKKAGDEADSISLSADAKTEYYTFNEQQLNAKFGTELNNGLPGGTKIQTESIQSHISKIADQNDPTKRKITFDVQAKAVPVFDQSKLLSQLTAKSASKIGTMIKDQYHAQDVEVINTPRIPPFSMITPFFKKNITLNISYQ